MWPSSTHCEFRRTSVRSEIISIVEQALPLIPSHGILIGSRAACRHLPNFRGESHGESNIDWDIICSSQFLLQWFTQNDTKIDTIDLIIPTSIGNQLDLYVCCILTCGAKYDFAIPRSSTSYTAYLLHNLDSWIHRSFWRDRESSRPKNASPKLLLILKKYMLYHSHQWLKTAKDYRQLLTITDPLTDEDKVLCDLFIRNNEKLHGQRPSDMDEFIITPYDSRAGVTINRGKFFQDEAPERLSCLYQAAMAASIGNDILVGLEHICTRGPPWLADYTIDHLIDIQNEKFKHKPRLPLPCIEFEVDNHRLFQQIPELAMQKILVNITDTLDFYSMQLVCKKWYMILHRESFWRDLYLFRYGALLASADKIKSWKMLYLLKLEGQIDRDQINLEQLVDATIQLRQNTANDVLQLWNDLANRDNWIEPAVLSKINHILSNSYYIRMGKDPDCYTVQLVLIGLEHTQSRSKVLLNLRVGEYGGSYFSDHMEELTITCNSSLNEQRSMTFMGPALFGFHIANRGYGHRLTGITPLLTQTSSDMCPGVPLGILLCLFIMMVHPVHRGQFIKYLKTLELHCMRSAIDYLL